MKTNYLTTGLIVLFTILFSAANADTFNSTTTGGDWNDPATWEENDVPTASDDVVVTGPGNVYVVGYNASTLDECFNLTINSGAVLRQKTNGTRGLNIFGSVLNDGCITDTTNSGYVYIHVYGDIENNGIWNNRRLLLEGTATQSITCGPNKYFGCYEVFDNDFSSDIEVLSDIEFRNTRLYLNNTTMILPVSMGTTLAISDGWIQEANITGNNAFLYMDNDAYFNGDVTISDVTLQGVVDVYSTSNVMTGDINVEGTLQNRINSSATLNIDGNLTNNGIIKNSNNHFTLYVSGDIDNSGTWQNTNTWLSGTETHSVSQGASGSFSGKYFYAETGTGQITAETRLDFNATDVDFNLCTIYCDPIACDGLYFNDGSFINVTVYGNGNELSMDNDCFLGNITIHDFILTGTVDVFGITVIFEGDIIVDGILQNRINSSATLNIDGNLTNNGIIQNSNNNLTIFITGDIVNNGTWQNTNTWLSGIETHSVSQGASGSFSGTNFNAEAGTGTITANSPINFDEVNVDLNGGVLILDPVKGDGLTFIDGRLREGTVYGNGNDISMDIDSFLEDVTMHDFVLQGTVPTWGNNVVFEGTTFVEGTLKNYSQSSNVTFNGPLTNNGTMDDLTNNLNLYLNSDFINNGICTNNQIVFDGTSDQYVACLNGNIISVRNIANTDPTAKIIASDNVSFHTSLINLNGGELQMPLGKKFTLTGSSSLECRLYDGSISGEAFDYEGNSDAYMQNITFEPEVTFYGQVEVLSQVNFNSSFNNNGILQLRGLSCTINAYDRIVNNGTIQDGTGNNLSIKVQSHIINNGDWLNYRTFLNGTEDQLIYLIAGKEITGQVHFEAMFTDPTYQWQHNGIDLNSSDFTGETNDELIWTVPVSNDYNGYFVCQGSLDSSRHILIRSGIIIDPVVQLQGPYNGTNMNTELAAQDLIPLTQPFNVAPWNYAGDEEVTSIPSDIVDWILVELRETTGGPETATTIVMQRALLLRNDGRAVDPYHQTPELKYDIDLNDNIYLVVWHRNHLGVMTAVPISDGDSPAYYDFSESSAQAYGGTDALMDLGNGVFGMMGGDADYNQEITVQDKSGFWDTNAALPCGYEPYDFTLDGQIDNQDKNQTWAKTLGEETQVPD